MPESPPYIGSLLPDCLQDDSPCKAVCLAAAATPLRLPEPYIEDRSRVTVYEDKPISDRVLWHAARHEVNHATVAETLFRNSLASLHAAPTAAGIASTLYHPPLGTNPGQGAPLITAHVVGSIAVSLAPLPGGRDDYADAVRAASWIVRPCVVPRLFTRVQLLLREELPQVDKIIDRLSQMAFDAARTDNPDITGQQVRAVLAEFIDDWYGFGRAIGPKVKRIADLIDIVARRFPMDERAKSLAV